MIVGGGKASVTVNAIPLTGVVRMVTLDLKTTQDLTARIGGLRDFTMTLRGRWEGPRWPFYRPARIRRMHTAYGRRRGRGRW